MPEYCPVLKPSFEDFIDFKRYIKSIEDIIFKHGMVKILPPPSWNPRHSIKCLCGPGNFDKDCVREYENPLNDNIKTEKESYYDKKYFGNNTIYSTHDNYIKKSNSKTREWDFWY